MFSRLIGLGTFVGLVFGVSVVFGQCSCGVSEPVASVPAVTSYSVGYTPTTTYYSPAEYTSNYAPTTAYYTPTTTYYTPTVVNYTPVTTYYAPQPYVSYYVPTTTYYTPSVTYSPVAAPSVAVAAPVVAPRTVIGSSVYGTPKAYVRGEPVRNALRGLTP